MATPTFHTIRIGCDLFIFWLVVWNGTFVWFHRIYFDHYFLLRIVQITVHMVVFCCKCDEEFRSFVEAHFDRIKMIQYGTVYLRVKCVKNDFIKQNTIMIGKLNVSAKNNSICWNIMRISIMILFFFSFSSSRDERSGKKEVSTNSSLIRINQKQISHSHSKRTYILNVGSY